MPSMVQAAAFAQSDLLVGLTLIDTVSEVSYYASLRSLPAMVGTILCILLCLSQRWLHVVASISTTIKVSPWTVTIEGKVHSAFFPSLADWLRGTGRAGRSRSVLLSVYYLLTNPITCDGTIFQQ